jgi:hypothetical protein
VIRNGIAATIALLAALALPAARAEEGAKTVGQRFYAGISAASLHFDDEQGGQEFSDSSTGLGLYAGFQLKPVLALELSYDDHDAIDLHDVAGSGVLRLDVLSQRRTVAITALREVSLKDLFNWKRDWRVFGTLAAYDSRIRRSITTSSSGAETTADDDTAGLALGAGVLYRVGPMELRGYVRGFGMLDRGEAKEAGAAVQLRF